MRIGVHGLCESAFTENAKHRSRCMRILITTEIALIPIPIQIAIFISKRRCEIQGEYVQIRIRILPPTLRRYIKSNLTLKLTIYHKHK